MKISRWLKVVFVALFFALCSLGMLVLAILTMDKPELEYITELAYFMSFFFLLAGIAAALEP